MSSPEVEHDPFAEFDLEHSQRDARILSNLYYEAMNQVPGSRQEQIACDNVDAEREYQSDYNEDGTKKWHAENDPEPTNTRVYKKKRRK